MSPERPADLVDVDDVGMVEPGGELGLPPEALDHFGVLRPGGVQHLERDLTLEVQVPHPVHPAEPAGPDQLQHLVVVAQRAAEPLLEARAVLVRHRGDLAHAGGRRDVEAGVAARSSSISAAVR